MKAGSSPMKQRKTLKIYVTVCKSFTDTDFREILLIYEFYIYINQQLCSKVALVIPSTSLN